MQMQSRFLSDPEKERIHRDSLRVLAEVGIRFRSARARALLTRHGAKVEPDGEIVRIPAEMVAQALKTAPRSFTLGARLAAFDFALPSAFTGYTLDGAATFAMDFETRRTALCGHLRPDGRAPTVRSVAPRTAHAAVSLQSCPKAPCRSVQYWQPYKPGSSSQRLCR
jgi:hypothetical protein